MKLLGTDMSQTTYDAVVKKIETSLEKIERLKVFTPNPEIFLAMSHDDQYETSVQSADILLPDGIGIFIAYQIADFSGPTWLKYLMLPYWCINAVVSEKSLHKKYGERITGSDLTRDVIDLAVQTRTPVVILDQEVEDIVTEGDRQKQESQDKTVELLTGLYPGLQVSLVTSMPSGEHPYILLCTVGGTAQETLVSMIMHRDPHVVLGMGIGGSIDIITGFREQAPQWVRKMGFEWLYRLIKRPKRHWGRIVNVGKFLNLCIKY